MGARGLGRPGLGEVDAAEVDLAVAAAERLQRLDRAVLVVRRPPVVYEQQHNPRWLGPLVRAVRPYNLIAVVVCLLAS